MAYWLFKSEPFKFSFEMLKAKGNKGEQWDGVRNYLARNNMRQMQIGDLGFFYHSNEGLEVVASSKYAPRCTRTRRPTIRAGSASMSVPSPTCRSQCH